MSFDCPICNWSTDDEEECDQHCEEHLVEIQMAQVEAFGKCTI